MTLYQLLQHFVESTVHCQVTVWAAISILFLILLYAELKSVSLLFVPITLSTGTFQKKKKIQKNSSKGSLKTFKMVSFVYKTNY